MTQTYCPPPPAHIRAPVVRLDQHRAARLEAHVNVIRARLYGLQRKRVQAELSAGTLWRELAILQRELRGCRARLARDGAGSDTLDRCPD
jgi:hypothetical protein